MNKEKTLILNSLQVNQKITRMAHEIYENHHKSKELVLIGISGNGNVLANRIAALLKEISKLNIQKFELTLNKEKPLTAAIEFTGDVSDLKGKEVIVIDDVLNSGKTLMYACRFILEVDVKRLSIATFVDRFHRKFPLKADYSGLVLSTNLKEHVSVDLSNNKESVHLEA
ncbi:MAG: phosphoribosyltransferase family protein [Flavobacteriales bacterium]